MASKHLPQSPRRSSASYATTVSGVTVAAVIAVLAMHAVGVRATVAHEVSPSAPAIQQPLSQPGQLVAV